MRAVSSFKAIHIVIAATFALLLLPAIVQGAGEYEPNDTEETAFGPLAIGQGLNARLESTEDTDYYLFYVARTASVRLAFQNQFEPGTRACGYVLAVYKPGEKFVTQKDLVSVSNCNRAESDGELIASLKPGRYYLRISEPLGYGIDVSKSSYLLTPVSGISTRSEVQAVCNRKRAVAKQRARDVTRATAALQSAKNRGEGIVAARRALAKAKRAQRKSAAGAKTYCGFLS